jgi:hypothetical protein
METPTRKEAYLEILIHLQCYIGTLLEAASALAFPQLSQGLIYQASKYRMIVQELFEFPSSFMIAFFRAKFNYS